MGGEFTYHFQNGIPLVSVVFFSRGDPYLRPRSRSERFGGDHRSTYGGAHHAAELRGASARAETTEESDPVLIGVLFR